MKEEIRAATCAIYDGSVPELGAIGDVADSSLYQQTPEQIVLLACREESDSVSTAQDPNDLMTDKSVVESSKDLLLQQLQTPILHQLFRRFPKLS
jgi:hypothetical protein